LKHPYLYKSILNFSGVKDEKRSSKDAPTKALRGCSYLLGALPDHLIL
jgi:hypothetical protein